MTAICCATYTHTSDLTLYVAAVMFVAVIYTIAPLYMTAICGATYIHIRLYTIRCSSHISVVFSRTLHICGTIHCCASLRDRYLLCHIYTHIRLDTMVFSRTLHICGTIHYYASLHVHYLLCHIYTHIRLDTKRCSSHAEWHNS